MISVLIPCFNSEKFLAATLESVFAQTRQDFEVILADDGSTDSSIRIAEGCGRAVKILRLRHGGAAAARNAATAAARGEYLQYLDADDLLEPEALELKVKALERSGADVAYSDWRELEETADGSFKPGRIFERSVEQVHAIAEIALFAGFWAPPVTLLYRRSIVERIGLWRTEFPIIQDARFLLDAAFAGARFERVPSCAAFYRKHRFGGSLATSDDARLHQDILLNAMQVLERWRTEGKADRTEYRSALAKVFGHVAGWAAQFDPAMFERVWPILKEIDPGYLPTRSKLLRWTATIVGYPNAERIASVYRRWKGRIHAGRH